MKKQFQRVIRFSVFGLLVCSFTLAVAQQTQSDASKIALYKTSPVWKDMMNDPNANYFEVQKAFELFWEDKELPLEEDDIIGEKRKLKDTFINRLFNTQELREQQEREALAFDCKKYRWWLKKTEPYIHDDGSIMSSEERLELWKKHYEELREQGNK